MPERRTAWVAGTVLAGAMLLACSGAQPPSRTVETGAEAQPGEQARYGGTLTFPLTADPDAGFDPHIPGGRGRTRAVIGLAEEYMGYYDVLPGEECGFNPQLWLGERWRFADPNTIEIVLKRGIKFQNLPPVNGRELAAEDVVYSYKRLFDRGLQRGLGEQIKSIEASDRYTVRITTKSPQTSIFADLLSYYTANILAKEAAGPDGLFDTRESVIGTGPYILDSYTPGVGHVFKRNPDYWVQGRPYLDEIRVPIIREPATQLASFRTGKVDFLWNLSLSEARGLQAQGSQTRLFRCELSGTSTIQMRNDVPPFSDVRVRRAMSMALDREGIIKGVYGGEGNVLGAARRSIDGALKPEEFPPETRKYLSYDPAEAKRLLAEAGYSDGLSLTVLGDQQDALTATVVEALPSMAKAAGFNITLEVPERQEFSRRMDNWSYGVAAVSRGGGGGPAIEYEISMNHSREIPARNRAAVKDQELDRLIDGMLGALDQEERWKVSARIQTRIVDQAYWVFYPSPFAYYPLRPELKGAVRLNTETVFWRPGLMFMDTWRTE